MPSQSEKSQLKELVLLIGFGGLAEIGVFEALLDDDDVLVMLTILETTRYLQPRTPIPKSIHWFETVLPVLDDNRFRTQLRMGKQAFCDLLVLLKGTVLMPL
jgi:hypothetical protein